MDEGTGLPGFGSDVSLMTCFPEIEIIRGKEWTAAVSHYRHRIMRWRLNDLKVNRSCYRLIPIT